MANWWESAPLASNAPPEAPASGSAPLRIVVDMSPENTGENSANWWEAAPVQEAPQQQREGLLPQFISGAHEGISSFLSLPNTIEMGLRSIGPAAVNAFGGNAAYPETSWLPDMGQSYANLSNSVGAMTEPTDDIGGRIVRRVGQEFGANVLPGAALISRASGPINALRLAATETALTGGGGLGAAVANEMAPGNPLAELIGQTAGTLTAGGALSVGRGVVTPFPMSDERLSVARALQNEGIDLTAGQTSGSRNLRAAEAELGGPVAQEFTERQAAQFTSAALRRAGIQADRATPEVMDNAFRSLGAEFDRLAANTLVPLDEQLGMDIGSAWRNYRDVVPESKIPPIAQDVLRDLGDLARGHGSLPGPGTVQTPYLSGDAYKSYRSRINEAMRRTSDPELKMFLQDIVRGLDDSAERYLTARNPEMMDDWRTVRRDYRNLLTLEAAATGAGELAASGFITPARLRQAVVGNDRRGYVRGWNDFADLTRNANTMMTPLPDSGTSARLSARNMFSVPSAVGGAVLGTSTGDPLLGIAGGVAGSMVPGQVGRGLLSAPGRSYLTNQALRPLDPGMYTPSAVARALAASGEYDQ